MKNFLFVTILFFLYTSISAQNVFYGYPSNKENLSSGSVIVMSGPPHVDARFTQSKMLDEFIEYFSNDFDHKYRIEVNIFYGSPEASAKYSENLCLMLQGIFDRHEVKGFTIVSKGSSNPIYLDKNSKLYKRYNTRMEIHIE